MQQVVPEVPNPDEQTFNMISQGIDEATVDLVQNQQTNNADVAARLEDMAIIFRTLRKDGLLRLAFQSIELTLMVLALVFLPHDCFQTSLRDMFILAIVVDSFQAFRQLHLIYIVVLDLRELAINGQANRLPYPEYSYQSAKMLTDAIADSNMCFKFEKYIIIILEISIFVQAQISIYGNLKSACDLGDSENDFTWGIAFMFLIIRYITVGLPLVLFILYILIAPIAYCIHVRLQSKINRSGATDANINRLQFKTVDKEKLTEDNECVICLQEFVTGEEYLVLKCHPHHIYHRLCIVDWIKTRSECPKCRTPINFD